MEFEKHPDERDSVKVSRLLQTASGRAVKISDEAISRVTSMFDQQETDNRRKDADGFKTPATHSSTKRCAIVSGSDASWSKSNSVPTIFQSARGSVVTVSREAKNKAAKIFDDTVKPTSIENSISIFQTARGGGVKISEEARQKAAKVFIVDSAVPSPEKARVSSLLTTARGGAVKFNADSLRKAAKLLSEPDSNGSSRAPTLKTPLPQPHLNRVSCPTANGPAPSLLSPNEHINILSTVMGFNATVDCSVPSTCVSVPSLHKKGLERRGISMSAATHGFNSNMLASINLDRQSLLQHIDVQECELSDGATATASGSGKGQHPIHRLHTIALTREQRMSQLNQISSVVAQSIEIRGGVVELSPHQEGLLLSRVWARCVGSNQHPGSAPDPEWRSWLTMQLRWAMWTLAAWERRRPELFLRVLLTEANVTEVVAHRYAAYAYGKQPPSNRSPVAPAAAAAPAALSSDFPAAKVTSKYGQARGIAAQNTTVGGGARVGPGVAPALTKENAKASSKYKGSSRRFSQASSMSPLQRCSDICSLVNPLVLVLSIAATGAPKRASSSIPGGGSAESTEVGAAEGRGGHVELGVGLTVAASDGWWWTDVVLDNELQQLVAKDRLRDGCKVVVFQAAFELQAPPDSGPSSTSSAAAPSPMARMCLWANGVRKARGDALLGYCRSDQLVRGIALRSLRPDGGSVFAIRVKVLYVCPKMSRVLVPEQEKVVDSSGGDGSEASNFSHKRGGGGGGAAGGGTGPSEGMAQAKGQAWRRRMVMSKTEIKQLHQYIQDFKAGLADRVERAEELSMASVLDDAGLDGWVAEALMTMDGGGGDGGLGGMEPTVAQMRELERAQHKVQMLRQQIADGLLRDMSECCEVNETVHRDVLVECCNNGTRPPTLAWVRFSCGKGEGEGEGDGADLDLGPGGGRLAVGATAFITNLKPMATGNVHGGGGLKPLPLFMGGPGTRVHCLNRRHSKPAPPPALAQAEGPITVMAMDLPRQLSPSGFGAKCAASAGHESISMAAPCDLRTLLMASSSLAAESTFECTIVAWFESFDEIVRHQGACEGTAMGCVEVQATDRSRTSLLLRYPMLKLTFNAAKKTWLRIGARVRIVFGLVQLMDEDHDIISIARGDRTTVTNITNIDSTDRDSKIKFNGKRRMGGSDVVGASPLQRIRGGDYLRLGSRDIGSIARGDAPPPLLPSRRHTSAFLSPHCVTPETPFSVDRTHLRNSLSGARSSTRTANTSNNAGALPVPGPHPSLTPTLDEVIFEEERWRFEALRGGERDYQCDFVVPRVNPDPAAGVDVDVEAGAVAVAVAVGRRTMGCARHWARDVSVKLLCLHSQLPSDAKDTGFALVSITSSAKGAQPDPTRASMMSPMSPIGPRWVDQQLMGVTMEVRLGVLQPFLKQSKDRQGASVFGDAEAADENEEATAGDVTKCVSLDAEMTMDIVFSKCSAVQFCTQCCGWAAEGEGKSSADDEAACGRGAAVLPWYHVVWMGEPKRK